MRLAFFTPLPPARTGTADYAASLLAELEKLAVIEVFEKTKRSFQAQSYDAVVYQIANNPFHASIYEAALRHPGIAVLHETNLQHLLRGMSVNGDHDRRYIREVVFEIFGCELAEATGEMVEAVSHQPQVFSMLRRILQHSRACIVHSSYAEREVRAKGFSGPVAVIPHGASVQHADRAACRRHLEIPIDVPVVGIFGYHRPEKQTSRCIRIFSRIAKAFPDARLLISGQPHPELRVQELITELGIDRRVVMNGFNDDLNDFDRRLAACDVILNLRHPTLGETSGTMMRAFGIGTPVIVSDNGAATELPDNICVKVQPDAYEERVTAEVVRWLLENPDNRKRIAGTAQEWVISRCLWPTVARNYIDFLQQVCGHGSDARTPQPSLVHDEASLRAYVSGWVDRGTPSNEYFTAHAFRLAKTLSMVPPGSHTGRVLEIGCYLQVTPALKNILHYGEVRGCYLGPAGETRQGRATSASGEVFECPLDSFNAERDLFPYPDEFFTTVLSCEVIEHLASDPMHLLKEVNRILKPGGFLVLTTPNAASLRAVDAALRARHPGFYTKYARPKTSGPPDPPHAREYTPGEIVELMQAGGFVVSTFETAPYSDNGYANAAWIKPLLEKLQMPLVHREDCMYLLARKADLPITRFPSWLYD